MKTVLYCFAVLMVLLGIDWVQTRSPASLSGFFGFVTLAVVTAAVAVWLLKRTPRRVTAMARNGGDDLDRLVVGIHEAGHAVSSRRGGIAVKRITINSDGSGSTQLRDKWIDEDQVPEHLRSIAAGCEAEARFLVKRCGYSWSAARRHAARHDHGDRANLRELASPGQARAAQREAAAFVARNWSAIEREGNRLAR